MNFQEDYPKLNAAAWLIAHDSGAINRAEDSSAIIAQMQQSAIDYHQANLSLAEQFLSGLSEDDLEELCCGEEGVISAPEYVSEILDTMYDHM